MKQFIVLSESKNLDDLIKMETKTTALYKALKVKNIKLININFQQSIFIDDNNLFVDGKKIEVTNILGVTFASMGTYITNTDFINLVDFFEHNGIKLIHKTSNLKYFSKINQAIFFKKNGVDFPETLIYHNGNLQENDYNYINNKFYNKKCVIKTGIGANGHNVKLLDTGKNISNDIQSFLSISKYKGHGFIIQEFIEGAEGVDLRVVILKGKPIYAFKRINTNGDFRSNITSQGSSLKEIHLEKDISKYHQKKIYENISKINHLNLEYYCIDFMIPESNIKVSEINIIGNFYYPQFDKNGVNINQKILKNIFKIK